MTELVYASSYNVETGDRLLNLLEGSTFDVVGKGQIEPTLDSFFVVSKPGAPERVIYHGNFEEKIWVLAPETVEAKARKKAAEQFDNDLAELLKED
jgi:hypothetical protein